MLKFQHLCADCDKRKRGDRVPAPKDLKSPGGNAGAFLRLDPTPPRLDRRGVFAFGLPAPHLRLMAQRDPHTPSPEERREQQLDEALEETFPASDPPAITAPRPHPHRDPSVERLDET